MCGICGKVNGNDSRRVDAGVLGRMCEALSHRGPDDHGTYLEGPVGLGHRRLSIIDLDTGHQPLSNEDGSVWIVFNGEIYNYRGIRQELQDKGHIFSTRTDTEVIVHLYEEEGIDCVKKLRGMFAFALWDVRKKRLVLARDRLGQKPLFYTVANGSLTFASEVKALLRDTGFTPEPNPGAIDGFLSFKFVPGYEDMISGIHKVPPAGILIYEKGAVKTERYWELYYRPDSGMTEEEAIEKSEHLLQESVKLRLMSDVPLGAFLSSGIDSGLVVSMMRRASGEPVNTFSIGDDARGFSELPFARITARHLGTAHREFIVKPDAVAILPDLIWGMDGPYADIPALPMYYISRLARKHVTVVLTGDAGDESFMGYDRYVANLVLNAYRRIPACIRKKGVPAFLKLLGEKTARKSWRQSLRWFNSVSLAPSQSSYARGISFFSFENEQKERLYAAGFRDKVGKSDPLEDLMSRYWSDHAVNQVDRMSFTDLMVRMPEYSNVKVDRISMIHSLEARSPFMDHKLVEFAATIPAGLKFRRRQRKYLLKNMAKKHLPPEIIRLPKRGFGSPINEWLRGDLKKLSHLLLDDSRLVRGEYFNQNYIDHLLAAHESGRVNNGYKIWSLVNLETWYRIYFGERGPEASRENVRDMFQSYCRTEGK
ncbi:MAG: asparagine synthase (glutamine-hydrolyzing) [Kiritimatiellia bacterium]